VDKGRWEEGDEFESNSFEIARSNNPSVANFHQAGGEEVIRMKPLAGGGEENLGGGAWGKSANVVNLGVTGEGRKSEDEGYSRLSIS